MKSLNVLTRIGFLPILLVACQKGSESGGTATPTLLQQEALTIDCGQLSLSEAQKAQLVGPETVGQNKAAMYSLSGVSSCGSHQKLMTFSEPGTYQVSANLKTSSQTVQISAVTQVVGSSLEVLGPIVGIEGISVTFSLSNPDNLEIQSLAWDFGDGAKASSGISVNHVYAQSGEFLVSAVATFADGSSKQVTHGISVVPLEDPFLCVKNFKVLAPATGVAGQSVDMRVFLPTCLQNRVTRVEWSFGDSSVGSGLAVSHIYSQPGFYDIVASVYHPDTGVLWFNYPLRIEISPGEGSTTTTTTLPTTTTTIPPLCVEGETREKSEAVVSQTLQCGVDGQMTKDSQVVITEKCQIVDGTLQFVEVSRRTQIVREGACESQSCPLPDGSFIKDGDSRLMYSSSLPAGSCTSVSQVRICKNSELGGSAAYSYLSCANGCENFGPSGSVKTDVLMGQVQVALQCQYGETGFFDLYNQVADQTCQSGTIVTSNLRNSTLATKGQCPTYSWVGTENYTACSAACGGTQERIFQCQDGAGQLAPAERCGALVAESRVCDGDPDQARKVETSTRVENGNGSAFCPPNQIGVIVNQREITVTKTYACIDHSVQLESDVSVAGPWMEERYCRDYVARRCSQDSLTNLEGKKRLEWMVKCAPKVPVIKEFLDQFATVTGRTEEGTYSLTSKGRALYATFMKGDRFGHEVPWIAPKGDDDDDQKRGCVNHRTKHDDNHKHDDCQVPDNVYVAAVCVSSCATPEEQILAQDVASGKLAGVSFIQALTKNYQFVGTLASHSGMSSKEVKKTKVDQWVTEMMDTEHQILEFRTLSGGSLKVTPNHPLVSQDGKMKQAEEFKVGESLVKLGGALDEITSISRIPYFGKVYNVFVKSDDPIKNVVITNGYLNGTAFYQNEGSKHLNRVVFRTKLVRGVFE